MAQTSWEYDDTRIICIKANYIKELVKLKKPDDQEFSSWYKKMLGLTDGQYLVNSDFNKSLYTLNIWTKTIKLVCPKCWVWKISLKLFRCISHENVADNFDLLLTRCSSIECDYVSDESIVPLINKISWWQKDDYSESLTQQSVAFPRLSEVDEKYLYNLKKDELVSIIKKSNSTWLQLISKIIEKPTLFLYIWIFMVLLSFCFWFLFKSSWLMANIWKWWITITQNESSSWEVKKDENWVRYIMNSDDKYIYENDIPKYKPKAKQIINLRK